MSQGEILAELILDGDQEFTGSMEEVSSGMEEAGDSAEVASGQTDNMAESLFEVDNAAGVAAGAGMVAIGGAMETTLQSTGDLRSELNQTAETMGITQDQANDLAVEISDATFPLEDVSATMRELSAAGIESEEEMESLALEMDNIADATGRSAEQVTQELQPALGAMGEDIEDTGDHADTFTWIQQETNLELEEFTGVLERSGRELQDANVGMDEAAALMAAMKDEGMTSRDARQELNQALEEGAEGQEEIARSIGISSSELADQNDALEGAEGATDDYAEAANDTVTTTDRLRQRFSEFQLQAGGLLGPIDALAPALMAAGSAQTLFATVNFSAVIPSLAGVMAAMLPLLPIVLGLAAVAGALYVAWERDIGGIQERTEEGVDTVTDLFWWLHDTSLETFEAITYLLFEWDPREPLQEKREDIEETITGAMDTAEETVDGGLETVMGLFTSFHPAGILWDRRDEIVEAKDDAMESAEQAVDDGLQSVMDLFTSYHPAGILWDKREEIMDVFDMDLTQSGEELLSSFADGIRGAVNLPAEAVSNATEKVRDHLPFSDAKEGDLQDVSETGPALTETIADGIDPSDLEEESAAMSQALEPDPDPEVSPSSSGSTAVSGGGDTYLVEVDARIMPGAIEQIGQLAPGMKEEVQSMLTGQQREIERTIDRLQNRGTGA